MKHIESDAVFQQALELFIDGTRALEQGELVVAEQLFLGCLRLVPERESARYNLAAVYTLQASACEDQQRFTEAVEFYDKALGIFPGLSMAWSNKGLILLDQLQSTDEAIACLERATELDPNLADAQHNLGVAHSRQGAFTKALACYELALSINPKSHESWVNHGNGLMALSRREAALTSYDHALVLAPHSVQAWTHRSIALGELGRLEEALADSEEAVNLGPKSPEAWTSHGIALSNLKQPLEALRSLDRAIELDQHYTTAWINLGVVLLDLRQFDRSLEALQRAIELSPGNAEAWSNRGVALYHLRRYAEAIECYEKAIRIKPNYAEVFNNRGAALREMGRFKDAIGEFDVSLALRPSFAEAWRNRGLCLVDLHEYAAAVISFENAYSCDPSLSLVLGDLIHTQVKICQWKDLSKRFEVLIKGVKDGHPVASPFVILGLTDDPEVQQICARTYADLKSPVSADGATSPNTTERIETKAEKIRVAYFSADFHCHATMYLLAEFFELHDKNQFELYGFSFGPDSEDEMRLRAKSAFNQFFDLRSMSDTEACSLSKSLRIDIAVDLKGYTKDSRPGIFLNRAAPIQINYLGYPGTMGSNFYDYIIADNHLIPEHLQKYYTEKVIYIPETYQVNDSKRKLEGKFFSREEVGLPSLGFVFCCFNNSWKILPETFDCWMRILKSVSGSVLWLFKDNEETSLNLKTEAELRGVQGDRVIFAERLPNALHLSRYRLADLVLDTWPCNSHTTASDALWMGVPVLTYPGKSFASRVATSLALSAGTQSMIACSIEDYIERAISFANNPEALRLIKNKLSSNRDDLAIFNTRSQTNFIEKAYIKVYELYQLGLPPKSITL